MAMPANVHVKTNMMAILLGMETVGRVYRDPKTGKLILIGQ